LGTSDDALVKIFEDLGKDKKNPINTFRASDIRLTSHVPYGVLTGIPQLDFSIGRPGYPAGRIVELYGFQMCGKTTAALMALAQVQKRGGSGLFIDTEFAFDSDRAEELGVDVDNLHIAEATNIETVFRIINSTLDKLKNYNKPFIIIVDSITGVPTEWEIKKNQDFGSERPGKEAQAIKKGMRLITSKVSQRKIILLMINHAIETMASFGKRAKSGGGHSIKFASSVRVNFSHLSELREKKEKESDPPGKRLGQVIRIQVEKSKLGPLEYPNSDVELLNDVGFNAELSLLEAMMEIGEVTRPSNVMYSWGDTQFKKSEWSEVVQQNGGLDKVYRAFILKACEKGFMKPWSPADTKET
jgi:recombination protein RecA